MDKKTAIDKLAKCIRGGDFLATKLLVPADGSLRMGSETGLYVTTRDQNGFTAAFSLMSVDEIWIRGLYESRARQEKYYLDLVELLLAEGYEGVK